MYMKLVIKLVLINKNKVKNGKNVCRQMTAEVNRKAHMNHWFR